MHESSRPKLARRSRRRGLGALAVVSLLILPAAIAWACNPQAQLTPNQASYSQGSSTVSIGGSFFPRGMQIKVTSSYGASTTVTTNQSGAFVATLPAPTSPGNYTVTAARADGGFQSGLPKTSSFAVAGPKASANTPSARTTPPAADNGSGRSFVEPGVTRSPARGVAGSGGDSAGGGGSLQGNAVGGVAGGGSVVSGPSGTPVFAGSVAPAQSSFGAAPAAARERGAARSTGRAAATDSDVWSGFANGRTPSLTSDAAGAPESGTGSGLGLGIGLLAVGLLALVAGLTAAEVRRRRATA